MQLPANIMLALKYLRPKRTFISTITLLSVLGPTLGVMILIIVTSVMSGFDRDIRTRILGMQAHVQVFPLYRSLSQNAGVIDDPQVILKIMEQLGVVGAPVIEGPILLQSEDQILVKYVRGIDPVRERQVTNLAGNLKGRFDVGEGEALIGDKMAAELALEIGDPLLIHSPHKLTQNVEWKDDGTVEVKEAETVYLPEEVTVVGIFSMGVYEYDSSLVFVHIDQAADLFGYDWGSATAIRAKVDDPFNMQNETDGLRDALYGYRIVTWQEANEQLFGALRVEKNLMLLVLSFIIIVAAFCIAGTLITMVIQKTRDIGVLKAIGMPWYSIAMIFILQGAIIGVLGTFCGTLLGWVTVHFRNQVAGFLGSVMKVEIFPAKLYHLSQIPAQFKAGDILLITGLSCLVCVLASLLPALYASLLSPAQALQDDS